MVLNDACCSFPTTACSIRWGKARFYPICGSWPYAEFNSHYLALNGVRLSNRTSRATVKHSETILPAKTLNGTRCATIKPLQFLQRYTTCWLVFATPGD